MKKEFGKVWELTEPCLRKALRKDYVLHTRMVVKSMEMILEKENGDEDILIPAAILHDVGWAEVPVDIQENWRDKKTKKRGEEMHLEYGPMIAREILEKLDFPEDKIQTITDIISVHHFKDPKEHEKQLLIDADNLSDFMKEQLLSDAKEYSVEPLDALEYRRRNNSFYTKTAQDIFEKEYKQRKKELEKRR